MRAYMAENNMTRKECWRGGTTLTIETNHAQHLVTVWLPSGEAPAALDDLLKMYKGTRYKVAIFRSGQHDLVECTTGLLLNNRG